MSIHHFGFGLSIHRRKLPGFCCILCPNLNDATIINAMIPLRKHYCAACCTMGCLCCQSNTISHQKTVQGGHNPHRFGHDKCRIFCDPVAQKCTPIPSTMVVPSPTASQYLLPPCQPPISRSTIEHCCCWKKTVLPYGPRQASAKVGGDVICMSIKQMANGLQITASVPVLKVLDKQGLRNKGLRIYWAQCKYLMVISLPPE